MRALLIALALPLVACASGDTTPEAPGPSAPTPAPDATVAVEADSIVLEDPARRLTVRVLYPVVTGDVPARDAVNEQLMLAADGAWREMAPEAPLGPDAPSFERYDFDGGFEVAHADEEVVSVLQSMWVYSGGAHGNTFFLPQTYDLGTGRPLALADVIRTTPEALGVLRDAVIRGLVAEAAERFETTAADARTSLWLDDVTATPEAFEGIWTLGPDGLTVHYAPYAVSAYAAGSWHVTVPYAELTGHLGPASARIAAM